MWPITTIRRAPRSPTFPTAKPNLRNITAPRIAHIDVRKTTNSTTFLKQFKDSVDTGKPYDILIVDLTLPGDINGIQVYERIKADLPDQNVIITSGYSKSLEKIDLAKTDNVSFLKKPYSINDVNDILMKIFD